jgi:hypothetical protein
MSRELGREYPLHAELTTWLADRRALVIVVSVFAFFALIGAFSIAQSAAEARARRYLLSTLERTSTVLIDGEAVAEPSVVVRALRRLRPVASHHSSPTFEIRLTLSAGTDSVPVIIARDSRNPDEYWIYRPGSNFNNDALGQYAGRITSRSLGAFLASRAH